LSVAIIVPMLGRPHLVAPLLESIAAATPERHRVVFACTPRDPAVEAVRDAGHEPLLVNAKRRGDYARKIQAGIDATTEPLVFTGAIDLRFHPGWLKAAAAHITDQVGVVGTNDLCNPRVMAGEHATHCLVARWYVALGTIDEPGILLHHGYHHEYVDDELVGTAKARGAWAFAAGSHVQHLHPMDGVTPTDALYQAQRARMRMSWAHYNVRRRLWEGLMESRFSAGYVLDISDHPEDHAGGCNVCPAVAWFTRAEDAKAFAATSPVLYADHATGDDLARWIANGLPVDAELPVTAA
jgi:hypothetical protein